MAKRRELSATAHAAVRRGYAGGGRIGIAPWVQGRILTHAGSNGANYGIVWAAPQHDFAVVVMTNQGGPSSGAVGDHVPTQLINRFWKRG